MSTDELVAYIRKHGEYREVRALDDGSIAALGELMYTRAIYLGLDRYGYSARFCFENRALAKAEFDKLKTEDDEPQGCIARR